MHTKVETELKKLQAISIINLVEGLIEHASASNVSDIHIDPLGDSIRVRFRIDGVLNEVYSLPKKISSEIVSRIKVLASLRTDEHQAPQDGRFKVALVGCTVDIRVSIVPAYYGESIVLRLLPQERSKHSLVDLGFSNEDVQKIEKSLSKTYGMLLVTGPTGSGKTTTLYTLIQLLNPQTSVITIEDPIEYAIDSIRQIQVNHRSGLTFANGLRSVLRQDPDTIMIGEIRDTETASIAVNSALTGHLILSTLHTNDAASALPRLMDMKVEPYLMASVLNIIIAQRLVRKICSSCKETRKINDYERKIMTEQRSPKNATVSYGKGCEVCANTGYAGRISIYEILEISDDIRHAIMHKASHQEIREILLRQGMITLHQDGVRKVLLGLTTLEEVLRVIHE